MTEKLPLWRCNDFRPVRAESASEAARCFADRLARRVWGKRGYMRTIRLDCWAENGRSYTFESFIGYSSGQGETTGRNEWIYVNRV